MNTFMSTILIENALAQYEITKVGNTFKARLIQDHLLTRLPPELLFWKESGQWKANLTVNEHTIYQFGYKIDNQVLLSTISDLKEYVA